MSSLKHSYLTPKDRRKFLKDLKDFSRGKSVRELATELRCAKSTAHRLLSEPPRLVRSGYRDRIEFAAGVTTKDIIAHRNNTRLRTLDKELQLLHTTQGVKLRGAAYRVSFLLAETVIQDFEGRVEFGCSVGMSSLPDFIQLQIYSEEGSGDIRIHITPIGIPILSEGPSARHKFRSPATYSNIKRLLCLQIKHKN